MAARSGSILPYLLLLGGGYWGYQEYQKYSRNHMGVQAKNLRIRILGFHANTDGVQMDIQIQNPNTDNLEIRSFVGTMVIDGKRVGEIKVFGDYNVQGNTEMVIPMNVRTVMNVYQAAVRTMKKGISHITFDGTINVNKHALPLVISYSV